MTPAPAPRQLSTPAALPEGAPRVWTQSLPRNALTNAMLQETAVSGDGAARPLIAVAFPEQIAFRHALSSAFLAFATHCAQAFAHKNVK